MKRCLMNKKYTKHHSDLKEMQMMQKKKTQRVTKRHSKECMDKNNNIPETIPHPITKKDNKQPQKDHKEAQNVKLAAMSFVAVFR